MSRNLKQGKCPRCRVIIRWVARTPLLRDAICPTCETPLRQTSYLSRLPVIARRPRERAKAAVR